MSLNIPITQEIKDQNLANLESNLNQQAPLNNRAFLRVLSAMEAVFATSLYKYGVERALQNLALTATGEDLDRLGAEVGVFRKPAESAVLQIQLPGTNGTIIPVTVDFIGDSNGVRYFPDASSTVASGFAVIDVTAQSTGVVGNLNNGDTMSIATQIAGAETIATVIDTLNTGADEEDDETYRQRVLTATRVSTGGGNAADYKLWAEEVAGVKKAFPFAGKPFDIIATSYPGDRTVYIEADSTIDPDGIAPQSLLDEVREALNTDPTTGNSRPPLGLIDDTLFIESIIRTGFYVQVNFLDVISDVETQVKADIETALDLYFRSITPFVEGIDAVIDRNDKITTASVSEIVQDVVRSAGGSVQSAVFDTSPGGTLPIYSLDPNELGKLTAVTYVG